MFRYIAIFLILGLLLVGGFFFIGKTAVQPEIGWGVTFSQKYSAEVLGLDWKEAYLALLDDLKVKRLRISSHWDLLEPEPGLYDFKDLDWQIKEAEKHNAAVILAIGIKTPRWPECHIPLWAVELDKASQQAKVLKLLETVVERYKNNSAIRLWQVENEPFVRFGECPWTDKNFLKKEIALVKQLDPSRPVLLTDSGEQSLWLKTASLGDMVGTTLYRKVFFHSLKTYVTYPIPPVFYSRRALLVKWLFNKEVIGVELQAEPWFPENIPDIPRKEWEKTMTPERFKSIVAYAQKTGLPEFYFMGAEWWYWLKEKKNDSSFWAEAKNLFGQSIDSRNQ